jgi:hypothetical protein
VREEIHAAEAIADQILDIGSRYSEPTARVPGHYFSGLTRFHRGDLADSLKHLMQSISLNKENYSHDTTQDPVIGFRCPLIIADGSSLTV